MIRHDAHQRHRTQRGLTLVEILVALTLGLLVTLTVIQIYSSSKRAYRTQEQSSRIQEDSNYALDQLSEYLRMIGYINIYDDANDPNKIGYVFKLDDESAFRRMDNVRACGSNDNVLEAGQVIMGQDSTDTAQGKKSFDCVIFRYRGKKDGSVYNCFGVPVKNSNKNNDNVLDAEIVIVNSFFLRRDVTIGDWSLGCQSTTYEKNADPKYTPQQTFINHVQDMQIRYGVRTGNEPNYTYRYLDAKDVTNWSQVVSLKIALLLSSEKETSVKGKTTFQNINITDQEQTYTFPPWSDKPSKAVKGDLRLWRVFITTINLRNRTL